MQKFTWLYKSDGTPLKYKDNISNREETYVYDSTKRLIRQNSTVRYDRSKSLHTMEYGYDLMNNVSRLVNAANGVTVIPTYTYGKDNMITRHDMNTLRRHTYTYDSLNRLETVALNTTTPVGIDYYYYLSERNTQGSTLYTTSNLQTEVIDNTAYRYTYDDVGNILTISETTRANKDNDSAYVLKQSYEYDALDRLTRENDVKTGFTILYNYDAGGNISKKNYYFYTSIPTEGLSSPALVINYVFDTLWKDKLVYLEAVINGVVTETADIVYDNIGNPTNYLGGNLTWTGRELTSYDGNTYTYSSDGLRTSKTLVNGQKTEYYYSGSSLVFEHRDLTYNGQPDGMSLFYTYDDAGRLSNIRYIIDSIGYEHNYYPVCNSRGDVEAIYDYHGTLMAKYTYDAWGDAVSIKDAQGHEIYDPMHIGKLNPFRYRGYYYDAETGLYYRSFLKKGGFHVSLTSISISIDDSTPLVHIHRELHKDDRINKLGEILKEKIPLDFMYEFCDLVHDTGMRGKFSVVPMPGCLGDIVQGLRGFDQAQVELWLETARTRLAPAFDFCPEILTHGKAVDLTTGAILSENEEQWSFKQNRSTLAPYIAHALDLLRHKGIIATGVTSLWFFGIKVENDYAAAISDAFFSVLGKKDCWYFLHIKNDASDVHPIVSFSEGDRRVVSIPATTGDAFGDSLGSTRTDDEWINHMADYYLTFDGSSGVILDALARGSQPVILTHWQSLFSNGRHTGLMALRVLAERINKYLSDRVIWTNFTDLMNQALYGV